MSELRHRVAVENPTRVSDGEGGYTDTYAAATPSPVFASVKPATPAAIERVVGATVDAKVTHIVGMRYHASVTTKSRLLHKSTRVLMVRGIQNVDERNEWLVLACEEVV